jgi:hypothetical protein
MTAKKKPAKHTVTDAVLLVAACKMGWGAWDIPCLLSPREYEALKTARLLDRKACARWLSNVEVPLPSRGTR